MIYSKAVVHAFLENSKVNLHEDAFAAFLRLPEYMRSLRCASTRSQQPADPILDELLRGRASALKVHRDWRKEISARLTAASRETLVRYNERKEAADHHQRCVEDAARIKAALATAEFECMSAKFALDKASEKLEEASLCYDGIFEEKEKGESAPSLVRSDDLRPVFAEIPAECLIPHLGLSEQWDETAGIGKLKRDDVLHCFAVLDALGHASNKDLKTRWEKAPSYLLAHSETPVVHTRRIRVGAGREDRETLYQCQCRLAFLLGASVGPDLTRGSKIRLGKKRGFEEVSSPSPVAKRARLAAPSTLEAASAAVDTRFLDENPVLAEACRKWVALNSPTPVKK